jgi:predicted amidohydrolase YtcJ
MQEAHGPDERTPREQRLHAELFERALSALHERRWSRKVHASRIESVEAVLAKHAKALQALPDD